MASYKHWIWSVLFWVGFVCVALAATPVPADLGIPDAAMPYIRLVAFIATAVGGKLGISYLNDKKED